MTCLRQVTWVVFAKRRKRLESVISNVMSSAVCFKFLGDDKNYGSNRREQVWIEWRGRISYGNVGIKSGHRASFFGLSQGFRPFLAEL